jgi:hypothetical protein
MRDGAGLPVGLVPASARARGVTDEGLAPVRGVGTGHADRRNSPRVTQGSPRSHYPSSGARGLPPHLLWDARRARLVHIPARHASWARVAAMSSPDPPCKCRWTLLAVRSHTTGSGGRPAPRGAGDLARAASSRLRRHRHIRRRHRPRCRPTRRRLRSSLPHQEQVNEFGPTGLQPVPTRPAGRKGQGRALWALTSGLDRSCDESSRGPAPRWRWRPGVGSLRASRPGAGSLGDVTQAARGPDFRCRLA